MRDSFVFHTANREYLKMLSDEDQLRIYDFLSDFAEADGDIPLPEMGISANIVLKLITDRMKLEFEKYEQVRHARAEGGKKGGRPKKPKGSIKNLKVIEKPEGLSENHENPVYDYDSVFESDNESVCESENGHQGHTHTISRNQVEDYYKAVCQNKGVQSRSGFVDRFIACAHRDWESDVETWVQEDIERGVYRNNTPVSKANNMRDNNRGIAVIGDEVDQIMAKQWEVQERRDEA